MTDPGVLPIEFRQFLGENPATLAGTEFGGVDGLVAPPPHDVTTGETLHELYRQAADPDENPGAPVISELIASPYNREDNR